MPRAGNTISVSKLSHRTHQDVALLYAPTDDEKGARFMRVRKGTLQTGEVRPLAEGQSLCGQELVRMRRRAELPMLFDVEVIHPATHSGRRRSPLMNTGATGTRRLHHARQAASAPTDT